MRRTLVVNVAFLIVSLGIGAHAQQRGYGFIPVQGDTIRDVLQRDFPCVPMHFRLESLREPMPFTGCSVARYAQHQLALGAGRTLGVLPNDTARIRSATIGYIGSSGSMGGPPSQYWSVVFTLEGRARRIEVHVARSDARVTVMNAARLAKPSS